MTTYVYKVLGQVNPVANQITTLYTVPSLNTAVVSTVTICNLSSTAATFRLSVQPQGAAIANIECAGGADTRHLIGRDVLAALGPQGLLVNVARGSIVDSDALVNALEGGVIGGAAPGEGPGSEFCIDRSIIRLTAIGNARSQFCVVRYRKINR